MRVICTVLLGLVASVMATPALFERQATSFTVTCGRGTTSDAQCIESFTKGLNGIPDTVR